MKFLINFSSISILCSSPIKKQKKKKSKDELRSPSSMSTSSSTTSSETVGSTTPKGGPISRRQLEVAARVAELYGRGSGEGHGSVGMEEMLALCCGGDVEELREAFGVFDADGDGRISAEELHGVLVVVMGEGEGCGLEDCRKMIGAVDKDGDGFVCFEDFVRMMTEAQR